MVDVAEVLMPVPYLLVQMGTPLEVETMVPSMAAGLGQVYVWAWEEEGHSVRARFFAPEFGVLRIRQPAVPRWLWLLDFGIRDEKAGHSSSIRGRRSDILPESSLVWDLNSTSIGGLVARDEVRFLKL